VSKDRVDDDALEAYRLRRAASFLTLYVSDIATLREDVARTRCGMVRIQQLVFSSLPDDEYECRVLLQAARAHLEHGEAAAGIAICVDITTKNPGHTDATCIHARCLLAVSQPHEAFRMMLEALRRETNDDQLYLTAADAAAACRWPERAAGILYAELGRAPGDLEAARALVRVLVAMGRAREAQRIVAKIRNSVPASIQVKLFPDFDSLVEAAFAVENDRERLEALAFSAQNARAWDAACEIWSSLAASNDITCLVNLHTCRYHLGLALDMTAVLELAERANPFHRAPVLTIALLEAARRDDVVVAVVAAAMVRASFPDSMDLSGVPIWVRQTQCECDRGADVIRALRHLVARAGDKADQDELRWALCHYESYAIRLGGGTS
jgi:tetratricopeptide (TPR) repeat protein